MAGFGVSGVASREFLVNATALVTRVCQYVTREITFRTKKKNTCSNLPSFLVM
jgi:hypothetical protein